MLDASGFSIGVFPDCLMSPTTGDKLLFTIANPSRQWFLMKPLSFLFDTP